MTTLAPISDVAAMLRSGATTPRAVTEACLAQIARLDDALNAFTTVTSKLALAAADRAGAELRDGINRGPLHGVPVAIKDNVDVAGVPTGYGSAPVFRTLPRRSAALVDRLEAAGAIIIGKTNLLEFAYGAVNFVVGQTNNPWDTSRTSGGSSGGSAAAVATGMAFAAIGTDTGGSIRIPAAYCGIVGMKPTFGLVPLDGVFPLSWTLDHAGPLARNSSDALALLDILAGLDGATTPIPPAGRRFGVLRNHADASCIRPDVRTAFDAACAVLRDAGAIVHDVAVADFDGMERVLLDILLPEAAIIHESRHAAHPDAYAPVTLSQIDAGPSVSGIAYLKALDRRRHLTAAFAEALDGFDALISPTVAWVAPNEDPAVVDGSGFEEMLCTGPGNLTGMPAVSIYGGRGEGGLPVGLMLTGPRGSDRRLLRLAMGIESLIPSASPPLAADA